jgi:hypothetical protein
MLLYLKRPAPDQEPWLAAMIDGIRARAHAPNRHLSGARRCGGADCLGGGHVAGHNAR